MQKIIYLTLMLVMLMGVSTYSYCADDQSAFDEANKFFLAKEYDKACKNYEKLLELGYKDPSVYFNLSNAYILLGNPAKAVVNLERAKRIQPRGKDILKNLHNLKAAIQQDAEEYKSKNEPPPLTLRKFIRSFGYLSKHEISIAIVLLYLSFLIWSIIRKTIESNKVKIMAGVIGMLSFLLTIFFIFLFVGMFYCDSFYPQAVIMKKTKLIPMPANDDDYKDVPQLSEGMVVELIGSYNGYGEVTLEASGKTGWIRLDVVEKI